MSRAMWEGFRILWRGREDLSVPDRATITNMGTETGCTTSIFPSDEITREFLRPRAVRTTGSLLFPTRMRPTMRS